MTFADLPWELAKHLPWQPFTSPAKQWAVLPSFVVGELLFYGLAVTTFLHAWGQGDERRKHLLVWFAALLAGTANDMIFMALPLVNNFWQAQAMIMITPRLPLYIPCVYISFMYIPTVSAWRLGMPRLPRAALTGLAGSLFYAPYDVNGAKFLWWTWHDSDPPIARRLLGAPIGSTMWVITFAAAFGWLIGAAVDNDPKVSNRTIAKGLGLVCGLTTLIMMVQMTAIQQLDRGTPGPRGLVAVIAVFGALAAWGVSRAKPWARRASDRVLTGAVVTYFGVLTLVMALFDPKAHVCTSMHQAYGPCHVESTDITGQKRFKYLCAEDFDEDFTFDCVKALPANGAAWYTVCGKPHKALGRFAGGVAAMGVAGALLYLWLLGARRDEVIR